MLIGTQIKVVFWNFPTAFTSAQNQRLVDFYSALVSVNPYYDWVTFQYTHDPNHDGYFHYGSAAGYPITPASPSWTGYLAFNQNDWTHTPQNIFEAELAYQIQQGTLPAPGVDASTGDPNTLFMIHLPPQIGFSLNQGGVACADTFGYHSSFTATINGAATTIIYGVIPDFTTTSTFFGYNCNNLVPGLNLLPFDNMTVTASHEVFEAITNPVIDQPAWFNEIGDGCNQACLKLNAFDDLTTATGAVDSTTGSPYKVQLLWAPNVQECAGVFPAWWD